MFSPSPIMFFPTHLFLSSTSSSHSPKSRTSFHVINDAKNTQQPTPFKGHDHIFVRKGQGLNIQVVGVSSLSSHYLPHTHLTLDNLLLFPQSLKTC